MKYTFIAEEDNLPYSDYKSEKITVETKAATLNAVLESFERFLRGAGFYIDGQLDIVQEDEVEYEEGCKSNTMAMPGTIGGAKLSFESSFNGTSAEDLPKNPSSPKCNTRGCGLSREQLGSHTCFDSNCGLK